MRIDDFIVLGRTVPEDSKKYGQSVCMAGYSEELRQLMRIYPLSICSATKARSIISAELERNNKDSRYESWALKDRRNDTILEESIKRVSDPINKKRIRPILDSLLSSNIDELNTKRHSLGILKPSRFEIFMKTRDKIKDPNQLNLFDNYRDAVRGIKTANNYFYAPYVKIDAEKGQSCLQLREWGVYELIRKYEKEGKTITSEIIKNALHINDAKDVYMVVGNMAHARSIWLIIKTYVYDNQNQVSMFS